MIITSLGVESKEQYLNLSNNISVNIRFDPFYYRWYADYYEDGELIAAGVALDPDTFGLADIRRTYCGVIDTGNKKVSYEPYEQLGDRLAVIEIDSETI